MSQARVYLDFDLLVERDGPEQCWARVLSSPAGEGSSRFESPFRPGELDRSVLRVAALASRHTRAQSQRAAEATDIGARLYESVFAREIGSLYEHSLRIAQSEDKGLRLLVRATDPELSALPWELLYIRSRRRFIALSTQSPVVRYLERAGGSPPLLRPSNRLRIVVAIADVAGGPPIDVESERRVLQSALTAVQAASPPTQIDVVFLESTTFSSLQRALLDDLDALHLIGHAEVDTQTGEPCLFMGDMHGRYQAIAASSLGALLHDNRGIRLTVLDTDSTAPADSAGPAVAERLVHHGLGAAIGLQFPLSDMARGVFAEGLYTAMAAGLPVDASLAEARKALAVAGGVDTIEWAAPVLYTRLRSEAEQRTAQTTAVGLDIERLLRCRTVEDIAEIQLTLPRWRSVPGAAVVRERFERIIKDARAAVAQEGATYRLQALRRLGMGLNELSGQLDRDARLAPSALSSSDGDSARLADVAISWLAVVRAETVRVDRQVEQLQTVDSPYIVGTPLRRDAAIFVGRADIGRRLEQLIVAPWTPPLLLYGQRRMGKTSLLYNLGRLLPSTILPLFVDLQGPPAQADSQSGFLYHLADAMARAAGSPQGAVFRAPPREAFSVDAFSTFYAWLDDLDSYAQGRTLLLMLDEFEALDRAFDSGRIHPDQILGMLRHLIQHRTNFKVLLAGSHTLDQFQRWSSYLINVQLIKVGYFSEQEARKLIESPVPGFPLAYDSAAATRVIELTRGHPFLVQLLCNEIVALKNERPPKERRWASVQDVNAAPPAALDSGSLFFSDIEHHQVNEIAQKVLMAISAAGEGAAVDEPTLQTLVGHDLSTTLTDLRERDVVELVNQGYRFQVELIRQWFARSARLT